MATINLGNASPTEELQVDLKHAAIHIQPVTLDTPSLTPAATPEEASPADEKAMAGKKIFSMERPDDKARELAAKLTQEEQVRFFSSLRKELGILWCLHCRLKSKPCTRPGTLAFTGLFPSGRPSRATACRPLPSEKPANSVSWRSAAAARMRCLSQLA
jgi:hypothetical protein